MKFMVDDNEAEKVRRLLEAAEVNCIPVEDETEGPMMLNPHKAREAADALDSAFYWPATKEGDEYWNTVFGKLIEYANMEDF